MYAAPMTIQSKDGEITLDLVGLYGEAKSAFLADYADDPAVQSKIIRNGDLAEREYVESAKRLSPERCATAASADIERCMKSAARLALCHLAVGYRRVR